MLRVLALLLSAGDVSVWFLKTQIALTRTILKQIVHPGDEYSQPRINVHEASERECSNLNLWPLPHVVSVYARIYFERGSELTNRFIKCRISNCTCAVFWLAFGPWHLHRNYYSMPHDLWLAFGVFQTFTYSTTKAFSLKLLPREAWGFH